MPVIHNGKLMIFSATFKAICNLRYNVDNNDKSNFSTFSEDKKQSDSN